MEQAKIKHLKLVCYSSNVTMSVTPLFIDLIFSFFSYRFNIPQTVKAVPTIAFVGFGVYALLPTVFPQYAFV